MKTIIFTTLLTVASFGASADVIDYIKDMYEGTWYVVDDAIVDCPTIDLTDEDIQAYNESNGYWKE